MKPLTIAVTALLGVVAVAFGAYWLGQARAPRAPRQASVSETPAPMELSEDSAKPSEDLKRFNLRLAVLEAKSAMALPADPREPKAQPGANRADPFDPAAMKAKEQERVAAIESALRTEPKDGVWAPAAEGQLQTAIASAAKEVGAQFSLKTLKCLTSICEMVLTASSADKLKGSDLALGPRISGMGSVDIGPPEVAADGTATVTYRLFRQGYPRPDEGT